MMKSAFYFMLKALFVLEIFTFFVLTFLQKNGLVRNLQSFSKFMTSQSGQQITTIHILSNISRSNGKQIMIFGQIMVYNMKNVFLGKLYTKCGREASRRPFYKNQN